MKKKIHTKPFNSNQGKRSRSIGYIGLGKMGGSMVSRLKKKKWRVETYDVSGKGSAKSLAELVSLLARPRIIWIMVPAGRPVDTVITGLEAYLQKGDIVIDGGNSYYENSVKRAKKLAKKGVFFLDAGVSGGPGTVRRGMPAIMVGGEKRIYKKMEPLFTTLTKRESVGYMGKSGAGHFVKMIHKDRDQDDITSFTFLIIASLDISS